MLPVEKRIVCEAVGGSRHFKHCVSGCAAFWTRSHTGICSLDIIACNCLEIGFYHKGICSRNCPFKQSFFLKATIIPTMLEGIRKPITSIEFLDWKSIHNINLYPLSWGQGKNPKIFSSLAFMVRNWSDKNILVILLEEFEKWWGVRRRKKDPLRSSLHSFISYRWRPFGVA